MTTRARPERTRARAHAPRGLAAEPLQPQELVITLLGSYVRPFDRTVWSGGLVTLLGDFGFSAGAARVALVRLVRRDLLARVRSGRLVHYRITERAERLLAEGDRRIFSLGRAAQPAAVWTMLWHGIPETQRTERGRLARRLRFLGFGSLQDGVWISPHDREREVAPLLEELCISECAGILVGRVAGSPGPAAFVRQAWDLQALSDRYLAFAKRFDSYTHQASGGLEVREAFLVRTRLVHTFRSFPFIDPDLPDELMPDVRARPRAVKVFHTAYASLAAQAQSYFDEVTSSWRATGAEAGALTPPGSR